MGKLTLSVDQEIIDRAKKVAKTRKTSLSSLVSGFLSGLAPDASRDPFFDRLHRELQLEEYKAPSYDDDQLRDRHVAEKYG